jgi:hypothetical protein
MFHLRVKSWGHPAASLLAAVALVALPAGTAGVGAHWSGAGAATSDLASPVLAASHPFVTRPAALRAFQAPALLNTAPPPANVAEIMEQLATHNKELKDFVDRGVFNEVWVPALGSKDVAVYLDDHLDEIAAEKREPAQAAVARLVRACWLLDAVGDLGNRPQVVEAYTKYTEALTDVQSFFPGK